jgi:hypothetical protein
MTDKFVVQQDENDKWRIVDVEHAPHLYRLALRYATEPEAQAVAARFNLIMAEELGKQ